MLFVAKVPYITLYMVSSFQAFTTLYICKNITKVKFFPLLLIKGCYTPPDLYIIANIFNIFLYNLLFPFLDVLFHKGIIRIVE